MCNPAAAVAAVGVAVSAASTGITMYQQDQQADAMRESAEKAQALDQAQLAKRQQEITDKEVLDEFERMRQAQRTEGKIRVSAAESGAFGNSLLRQLNQNMFDETYDKSIIDRSSGYAIDQAQMQKRATNAAYQSRLNRADGVAGNQFLTGLQGIGNAASTGLSMYGTASQYSGPKPLRIPNKTAQSTKFKKG
jgi:hypothetical protein